MQASVTARLNLTWSEEFLVAYLLAFNQVSQIRQQLGQARNPREHRDLLRNLEQAERACDMLQSLLAPRSC
jgi:hypothetical protein